MKRCRSPFFPAVAHILLLVLWMCSGRLYSQMWTVADRPHPSQSGRLVEVTDGSRLVAGLVYGDGQLKPYLHVYGDVGELLTKGDDGGTYPHHRGIYIGWNVIRSSLGTHDLWHMTSGTMRVTGFERMDAGPTSATLVCNVEWRATLSDSGPLLLQERRTLVISRPDNNRTQIDFFTELTPARDLTLDGDLQHAGVHYRAPQSVFSSAAVSYLSSPSGIVKGSNLEWCRMLFPVGGRWYTSLLINAPQNPVEELSMRDYGRFGYFFKKSLVQGQTLSLAYRFVIARTEEPANPPTQSSAQLTASRALCDTLHDDLVAFQLSDFDGDGFSNAREMVAATNPYLPESRFQIASITRLGTSAAQLEFRYVPGRIYRIEYSDTLAGWTPVPSPQFTFPEPGICRWNDPAGTVPPTRFYRVTVE